MTQRIMRRAVEICPGLVKPGQGVEGLDIIRTYAGLRPLRIGGARLETEIIDGVAVVHNYGAGGFGCKCNDQRFPRRGSDSDSLLQIKRAMGWPRKPQILSTRRQVPRQDSKSDYSSFADQELRSGIYTAETTWLTLERVYADYGSIIVNAIVRSPCIWRSQCFSTLHAI
jgi:hypothetical protein